jgi:phosphatidylserine decarboxylase
MGHSPSRPNACAAAGAGAAGALPSRFARFRRRLRLHRRRSGGGDDSASKAVAADEFAGIARIRIVKVRPGTAGWLCPPACCCYCLLVARTL